MTSSVRWGIPDAVWAFVGGLAGAILAAVPFSRHDISAETATFLAATFIGQYGATVLVLVLISHRKGLGTLAADFGLRIRLSDAWMLGGGLVLGGALGLFLAPLSSLAGGKEQAVVQQLNNSSGPKLVVLAIGAGAIAPIVEELLFRGLLLRALLRRVQAPAAVAISATAFGLVHVLLDPSIGSVVALPGLTAVGMVSGVLAVRSGDLSRSIFLHAGFNALAILQVVVS
ncbi:MAG: putative metal-dependent rane protease [Actinomycetia bacterium]|nr:putative metal-dependent rane protease [Actinomycetes bacterium]